MKGCTHRSCGNDYAQAVISLGKFSNALWDIAEKMGHFRPEKMAAGIAGGGVKG